MKACRHATLEGRPSESRLMVLPSERGRENYLINTDTLTGGRRASYPTPVDMDDTPTRHHATFAPVIGVGKSRCGLRVKKERYWWSHSFLEHNQRSYNYRFERRLGRRQNRELSLMKCLNGDERKVNVSL